MNRTSGRQAGFATSCPLPPAFPAAAPEQLVIGLLPGVDALRHGQEVNPGPSHWFVREAGSNWGHVGRIPVRATTKATQSVAGAMCGIARTIGVAVFRLRHPLPEASDEPQIPATKERCRRRLAAPPTCIRSARATHRWPGLTSWRQRRPDGIRLCAFFGCEYSRARAGTDVRLGRGALRGRHCHGGGPAAGQDRSGHPGGCVSCAARRRVTS